MVKVRWFVTDLPPIDFPSVMNTREYGPDKITPLTVGELPTWEAKRVYNGRWTPPAGVTGKHICHQEWFATGEPWPVDLPDTKYDDYWIPDCCGTATNATSGGSESGGPVRQYVAYTHPTSGGSMTGGAVVHIPAYTHTPLGGSESGGPVAQILDYTHPTEGGSESGGVVSHTAAYTHATEGGSESGGPVAHTPAYTHATAGGSESGGVVEQLLAYTHPTAGGSESGGSVAHTTAYTHATSGGSESGGVVAHAVAYTHATAGGSESGGPVTEVFVPAPTPGATCAAAAHLTVGTTYTFVSSGTVGTSQWVFWNATPGVHSFTSTGLTGVNLIGFSFSGSSCATQSPSGPPLNSSPTTVTVDGSGRVALRVDDLAGPATTWTIKLT